MDIRRLIENVKAWAYRLRRNVFALWLAARDRRVPLPAKLIAGAVAAYALSPVDLIPDFIPVIGFLDELIVLPLGIALAIKFIPADVMADLQLKAGDMSAPPASTITAFSIGMAWLTVLAAAIYLVAF